MDQRARYCSAFGALRLTEERRAEILAIPELRPAKRRKSCSLRPALAFAAVLLLLIGGGAALAGQSGIREWFSTYWEAVFHRPMSQEQVVMVDSMTQTIGQSATVDGITVTVDSATVADDHFYLLLRVEGRQFSKSKSYGFSGIDLEVSPDQTAGGGMGSYGVEYHGLDEQGRILLLMEQSSHSAGGFSQSGEPLEVSLTLTDLLENDHTDRESRLAEGNWSFSFTLDRSELAEPIALGNWTVRVCDRESGAAYQVTVRDIQLTSSGVRYSLYYREERSLDDLEPVLILKDGTELRQDSGIGAMGENGTEMQYSGQWAVPVNLDEVAALRLGDTLIPVNE